MQIWTGKTYLSSSAQKNNVKYLINTGETYCSVTLVATQNFDTNITQLQLHSSSVESFAHTQLLCVTDHNKW